MNNALNWGELIAEAAASGKTFEPVPDGDYNLKVLEAPNKITQNQKTQFSVKAEIQDGPHARRLIWDNITISPESPGALGFFFRNMAALGLDGEFFRSNPSNDQISAALAGRSFRAKIGHRVWNGQTKNEIKSYFPAGASTASGVAFPAQANPPVPAPAAPAAPPAPPMSAAPPAPPAAPPAAAAPAAPPAAPAIPPVASGDFVPPPLPF